MNTSVLVPTYKRTSDLRRCLLALQKQTLLPDEVIVIVRDTDSETRRFIRGLQSTKYQLVERLVTIPGQVAALNEGLRSARGKFICILDDDTAPYHTWLQTIVDQFHLADDIGGIGGRDWINYKSMKGKAKKRTVGKIQWFGRVIGNHHLGYGPVRDVDVLKGANMSYRREAINELYFDERLLGEGAQVHNDMAFSLSVKRKGWRLIYDPRAMVDHFPARRFDLNKRDEFNAKAYYHAIYNETLIILEYMPSRCRRLIYILWTVLIGTRDRPGVLHLFRSLSNQPYLVMEKFKVNLSVRLSFVKKTKDRQVS
ncbi:glycosyltransferase family 2 protein [Amphibacillus cookii]|uniref:glycosyltransferase family 2 protein n=1 Tax=Amphibacillus cookii TaxID=767787 RepID=UPI001956C49C|nr:glycosyltransferase family 2 protein [Amphibacillus cookii]MBM7540665.1 cellulose synthase/poly-beta-1,6-N-acetylglucosamine synthase-like glycosyltransferase [Amphibacillus cookii]